MQGARRSRRTRAQTYRERGKNWDHPHEVRQIKTIQHFIPTPSFGHIRSSHRNENRGYPIQVRAPPDPCFEHMRRKCSRDQVARATRPEAVPGTEPSYRLPRMSSSDLFFCKFFLLEPNG